MPRVSVVSTTRLLRDAGVTGGRLKRAKDLAEKAEKGSFWLWLRTKDRCWLWLQNERVQTLDTEELRRGGREGGFIGQ